MNENQAIAEAERRFEIWWEAEGREVLSGIDMVKKTSNGVLKLKAILRFAWRNGALAARENN